MGVQTTQYPFPKTTLISADYHPIWPRGAGKGERRGFGVGVGIWSLVHSITVPELYFPLRKRLHNVDLEREVKNEKHILSTVLNVIYLAHSQYSKTLTAMIWPY